MDEFDFDKNEFDTQSFDTQQFDTQSFDTQSFDTMGFDAVYDLEADDQSAAQTDGAGAKDKKYGIFGFLADQPIFGIEEIKEERAAKPEEKAGPRAPIERTDRRGGALHDAVYMFGLQLIRRGRRLRRRLRDLFYRPAHAIKVFAGLVYVLFDKVAMRSFHNAAQDFRNLKADVRHSFDNFIHTFSGTPSQVFRRLLRYPGNAVRDHQHFFKTAANTLLPLAALAALIVTVTSVVGSTYALEVLVNNDEGELTSLGYVSSEAVYQEARNIVQDRIDSGASDSAGSISNPTYRITRVKLNQLSDADTISDRLIENSESKLSAACGIYIDNDFVCAVKNESDARMVFNNLLDEAADKFHVAAKDRDSFADFVEEVEFIQGLYSDDESKMWDAAKLDDELRNGKRRAAVTYIIEDGDSPAAVAAAYGISVDELRANNPDVNFNVFPTGTTLIIEQDVKYVRVQIKKYVEKREDIPFKTETVYSNSLYSGDKRTTKKGEKGVDNVTYLEVYVDGVLSRQIEIERTTLVEPVNAKVIVGTKKTARASAPSSYAPASPSSFGSYTVTVRGKFAWPVSGLYTITSPYGYRSSGFHTGIDISGGNASGKIVLAAESGIVEMVKYSHSSYGNQVVINHGNGIKTRYAHMLDNSICVSAGQSVTRGQAIGRVGSTGNSTGPHLHFEVIVNGSNVNPLSFIG